MFDDLVELSGKLRESNIHHALGGSGLLRLLGLPVTVNDWDISTDEPASAIERALSGYELHTAGPKAKYRSQYLYRVAMPNSVVEIIGRFSILTTSGIVNIKTEVHSYVHGVPLGSPTQWLEAYRAMGVPEKEVLLERYLAGKIKEGSGLPSESN